MKTSPSEGTKIPSGGESLPSEELVTSQSKEARTLTSPMTRRWFECLNEARVSEIKELISRGIDVNEAIYVNYDQYDDWYENNPKQDTEVNEIELGQDEIEKLLIETGKYEIEIPIHLVVNMSFDVASVLLEAGADVDLAYNNPHTNMYSGTALQRAAGICAGSQGFAMIQLLLSHGADVNSRPGPRGSALQCAAQNLDEDAVETVRLLLDHNADVNPPSGIEGTALQSAAQNSGKDAMKIVQLLLSHGADVNASPGCHGTALQSAIWKEGPEMLDVVELLVSHGADVNGPPGPQGTALQLAVREQSEAGLDVVKILLRHGADVNAPPQFCVGTALQAAVRTRGYKMFEIVKLLFEHGADIHALDDNMGTALQYAIDLRLSERSEIVPLLLTHGANVDDLPDPRAMAKVAVRRNDT